MENQINTPEQLIETLNKSKGGVTFVSVKGYKSSTSGEVSDVIINVGASFAKAKEADLITLAGITVNNTGYSDELFEQAKEALHKSLTNPSKNHSEAQKETYHHVANGVKVHRVTGAVYIEGMAHSKKILSEGVYKEVKSKDLTIVKDILSKDFKSGKWRNLKLENVSQVRSNGETLIFGL